MSRISLKRPVGFNIFECGSYEDLLTEIRSAFDGKSLEETAKGLGYQSKASLSMFLTGKRPFTRRAVDSLVGYFAWTDLQRLRVEDLVRLRLKQAPTATLQPEEKFSKTRVNQQLMLDPQQFSLVSNWYRLPLFLLLSSFERFPGFHYLDRKLRGKVSVAQIMQSTYALEKLGFIKRTGSSVSTNIQPYVNFSSDTPNHHLKEFHRGMLSRAMEAIDEQPVAQREFKNLTLSMDPSRVPEAKQVIDEFIHSFNEHFKNDHSKDICQVSVQMFWHTIPMIHDR